MKQLKWGVIGASGIADRRMMPEGILQAENARLVAITGRDQVRLREIGSRYEGVQVCGSEDELLERDEVQAVYIATPNDLHLDQCLKAARAGKHILCEKPLALTVEEGRRIVEEAEKAGVRLGCDYMMRYNVYNREVARLVQDGHLGAPVMGRAQLTCWYPPIEGAWRQIKKRAGGGAIMDLASHCVDLLEMIFGRATHVHCHHARLVHSYEVEDTSLITLRFESGAFGIVDAHFNIPDAASENVLEAYGSRGCVRGRYSIGQSGGGELRLLIEDQDAGYQAAQDRSTGGYQSVRLEEKNRIERSSRTSLDLF